LGPAASPADQALGLQVVKTYQMKFPVAASIAVRKGNAQLLNTLNTSLAKLKANGTVKAIFAKYGIESVVVN
jgi:polar amino acid transport system substrate-binding protein